MLDKEIQENLIKNGRNFTKGHHDCDPYRKDWESDQKRQFPHPPIVKDAVTPKEEWIMLTRDFSGLNIKNDLISVFRDRHSSRVYTEENVSLDELSFLLWATQGIKKVYSSGVCTGRTVACAGARHEFETYLVIRKVEGLAPGAYHYLPMKHALEFLHPVEEMDEVIPVTLRNQAWTAKSSVVFYWSMVPYRCEWRYGIYAHRHAMMDVGHIGQNLYLATTALGLGCCGIASFSHDSSNKLFDLDGEEEYIAYASTVGTVSAESMKELPAFVELED